MWLTAELLLNYQRCNRRAFLDVYGDQNQRDPVNDYLLKIFQDSLANHRDVLVDRTYQRPTYPEGDLRAGAAATLALMQQGVEQIYQGVLLQETPEGVTLVSIPDLLIRQPGQSILGDWMYVPAEIKLSKRPKLEYQIITAYHVRVLAAVQGAWPEVAWLLLRAKGLFPVDLWENIPLMEELLAGCIETLQTQTEPEIFISRNRCHLCHWFSHCYAIAKAEQHLSLLPGVTPSRYVQLQTLNLTTLEALAAIPPHQLELLPGFGRETAQKLIRQARSTLQNQAILGNGTGLELGEWEGSGQRRRITTFPELPTAAVELYFDIEAEPSLNLVYLHGVLVVDRRLGTEEFHPFLAERAAEERAIWEQFLNLVWQYPEAPIFHFCPFEVQTVERLGQLYGTPASRVKPLLKRFVDLHDRITQTVTLPVESYALKHIARWMGFDWRDPSANGAKAIYWYAEWLATGNRTFLQQIVDYNEDDCRATYHVKNWLVAFLQQPYAAERA